MEKGEGEKGEGKKSEGEIAFPFSFHPSLFSLAYLLLIAFASGVIVSLSTLVSFGYVYASRT